MYAKRFVVIITFFIGLAIAADDTIDGPWKGLWFPENPDNPSKDKLAEVDNRESPYKVPIPAVDGDRNHKELTHNANGENATWTGQWFPQNPDTKSEDKVAEVDNRERVSKDQSPAALVDREQSNEDNLESAGSKFHEETNTWTGKWFPAPPGQSVPQSPDTIVTTKRIEDSRVTDMGISELNCDDGMSNLELDYDPRNISHHYRHLCIDERRLYAPSYDVKPRLLDNTIPPEYVALHKCMDEEIVYDDDIPTFGTHRKLWPVYGEYVFVPPQRWIHNLEHGAIVLLYHPCANLNQLDLLKNLVTKCLYRHIITAYDLLQPERPFALVAWGRSLEFSVVDQLAVVSFIRLYGLQGPEKVFRDGQYNQTLIEQSSIVSSADDNVLCQNLPLFAIYLILGVCPFRVKLRTNSVECSILSLLYSIVLYISLSMGLLYFWVASIFNANILDTCETGTCNYVLTIQALAIFLLFIVSSLHTIFSRSAHVQLMNEIVDMEGKVLQHLDIKMFPTKLVRRVCVRISLCILTYIGLNVSAIYGLHLDENINLTIYHYLFTFEMLIMTLTFVHVIVICSILKQCSQLLLDSVKQLILEECSSKMDDRSLKVYKIFYFLDTINEIKIKMSSVFGMRLLVNQSMDFVLLTVAVYYFILVYMPLSIQFNPDEMLFLCVYAFPVILKNFALVAATDTLGNQVFRVSQPFLLYHEVEDKREVFP